MLQGTHIIRLLFDETLKILIISLERSISKNLPCSIATFLVNVAFQLYSHGLMADLKHVQEKLTHGRVKAWK